MKKMYGMLLLCAFLIGGIYCWLSPPFIYKTVTKQALYIKTLSLLNHNPSCDKAYLTWIDDDSGEGIFQVKSICDSLRIPAVFAAITAQMPDSIKTSLLRFHEEGFQVVSHSANHLHWKNLSRHEISREISDSFFMLDSLGFKNSHYIVVPFSENTSVIRNIVKSKSGYMITGAPVSNDSRKQFMLGRIFITKETEVEDMKEFLKECFFHHQWVILSTHSSNQDEFDYKKTFEIMKFAKDCHYSFTTLEAISSN